MKVIATAIIFTLLPVVRFGSDRSTQVRDQYGNFIQTKELYWDETTVRDRDRNITRTERFEDQGRKSIRDKQGNLIGKEEADLKDMLVGAIQTIRLINEAETTNSFPDSEDN
jgi:hypothetical protein